MQVKQNSFRAVWGAWITIRVGLRGREKELERVRGNPEKFGCEEEQKQEGSRRREGSSEVWVLRCESVKSDSVRIS